MQQWRRAERVLSSALKNVLLIELSVSQKILLSWPKSLYCPYENRAEALIQWIYSVN